MYFDIGRQS